MLLMVVAALLLGLTASYLNQVRFQPLPAAVATLAGQQIARIS